MEAGMPPMHNPAKIAAQYRAAQLAEGFELRSGSTKMALKRGGAFLHLSTAPTAVRWHAKENEEPFHVVHLAVTKFGIGHRGDEGWSNNLADACLFVIDGEALRHVPLAELSALSEERFNARKAWLAVEREDTRLHRTHRKKIALSLLIPWRIALLRLNSASRNVLIALLGFPNCISTNWFRDALVGESRPHTFMASREGCRRVSSMVHYVT